MPKSLLALGSLGCYGIQKPLPKLFSSRKHRHLLTELCPLDCTICLLLATSSTTPLLHRFLSSPLSPSKSSAFALAPLSEPEMRLKESCKGGKAAYLKSSREMAVRACAVQKEGLTQRC